MKSQNAHIFAKTGTLTGVSSYAGYLYKNAQWQAFALLINQSVNGNFRKRIAVELLN
jgi:D-alanyl-D-alanine carboxypeptidase/D-alanyl-D-alanine-endopeptidase (penicillin-binding protein 4)